jgi:hypothetical protein
MKHPLLPPDWNVWEFPATVEIYNGAGKLIHGEGKPYAPHPEFSITKVVERALDPCLRNPEPPQEPNAWQLHYKR